MKIILKSEKHGPKECLIDDEDWPKVKAYSWYVWSTRRHTGFYAVAFDVTKPGQNKSIRLHRLVLDVLPGQIVDHINGDPLDNRKANLRIATSAANNHNAKKRRNARTSKFKGVSWYKPMGQWVAQFQMNGKKRNLGYWTTEEGAARAYDAALDRNGIVGPRNFPNNLADLR